MRIDDLWRGEKSESIACPADSNRLLSKSASKLLQLLGATKDCEYFTRAR
jgi:hypothetical protein